MKKTIKQDHGAMFLTFLFLFFTVWWMSLHFLSASEFQNQVFSALYGIVALFGAVYGVHVALKWGGMKSLMGKSIIMFSLGLFAQEFGQLVYSFYNFFLHVPLPYPSIGDIGYFGSIPFYIWGVVLLAKISGIKLRNLSMGSVLQAVIIPFVILVVGYLLFLKDYVFDWSSPLTIILDFGYPLGEAIYISLAILTYLLSRKVLGGIMRGKILFILFALLVQFLADYTFLYFSHYSTVIPGGVNDYIYLISYFLMSLALIQLKTVYDDLMDRSTRN